MTWPTKAEKEAKARMAQQAEQKAPEIGLADIARLIQDVSGKVEAISERVGVLEQDKKLGILTNIRPMDPPEDLAAARRHAFAKVHGMETGGEAEGVVQIPLDSHGKRLPPGTILPRFHGDDRVMIRRNVAREGFPRGGDPFPEKFVIGKNGAKRLNQAWRRWSAIFPDAGEAFPRNVVWADLLDAVNCSGAGVIRFADYISKLGMWKYKAYIPGFPGMRKSGDGFYEYELMEA